MGTSMIYNWLCRECEGHGCIDNPGLPVTSLINQAAIDHAIKHPNCNIAKDAAVDIVPGGCVFKSLHSRERKEDQAPKDN